jgi:hypothetical protein
VKALEESEAGVWGQRYPAIAQSRRRNWQDIHPSSPIRKACAGSSTPRMRSTSVLGWQRTITASREPSRQALVPSIIGPANALIVEEAERRRPACKSADGPQRVHSSVESFRDMRQMAPLQSTRQFWPYFRRKNGAAQKPPPSTTGSERDAHRWGAENFRGLPATPFETGRRTTSRFVCITLSSAQPQG